ncbi:iron uptake transporter deferrochelatase/peroxidase subunit [Streptomyces xanthophaeus]|uniref:iron uptake transporter deferrochelatase/peroxidase subunit n=1 Tax=Streptomyces xanthophaeus TaxID=67385 RepID=UPI0026492D8E|nr:iron uptake transporter deferrochelatase/peroxidase subunit [Streptomyces xanthophaeus]WKD30956.1 deferrochelatase/peroxidase EfeB [Streptomyces xanthophaeus]
MPAEASGAPGRRRSVTRRALLGAAGLGAVAGGSALVAATVRESPDAPGGAAAAVPFHGPQQAGILHPRQTHAHLAAFDFGARTDRGRAAALLLRWSAAAERLTRGEPVGEEIGPPGSRAADTGVALGSGPASLTLTFGFGASFFDRVGLATARPEALAPLPAFPDDQLDPARGGGDLFVQIAADDPLVGLHALRTVQRLAHGEAKTRWVMSGFTTAPVQGRTAPTHRNLMGQLDGTANPSPADGAARGRILVTAPGSPPWLAGGSYVVVRRIRMLLDHWDTLPLEHREQAVGRRAADGSPLTGGGEHTAPDLTAHRTDGVPVIAYNAHIRLAAPSANGGATMLRRGWSYYDGLRADGTPDAGMLFVAWQSDPRTGFVPVQQRLARGDALGRYLVHEASSLFVVPGGVRPGGYVGQALLEDSPQ